MWKNCIVEVCILIVNKWDADCYDQFIRQQNTHLPKRKTMPQESDVDSFDGFIGQKTKNNSDEQNNEYATIQ